MKPFLHSDFIDEKVEQGAERVKSLSEVTQLVSRKSNLIPLILKSVIVPLSLSLWTRWPLPTCVTADNQDAQGYASETKHLWLALTSNNKIVFLTHTTCFLQVRWTLCPVLTSLTDPSIQSSHYLESCQQLQQRKESAVPHILALKASTWKSTITSMPMSMAKASHILMSTTSRKWRVLHVPKRQRTGNACWTTLMTPLRLKRPYHILFPSR